jgi:hypothetical protein
MSLKNGEMQTIALIGAVALSGAAVVFTLYFTAARAESGPLLQDMTMIEASIAYKKTSKKPRQPQKEFRAPDPIKEQGVSRDENKKPDEKKPKDKPGKDEVKEDFKIPDRTAGLDEPVGESEEIGAFDGEAYGVGDVTKGDPYFARLSQDLAWQPPALAKGTSEPIGCIQITADGKIPQTKFKEKSDDDLGALAETALRGLQQTRNREPEEVPTHLLKALTTQWICFKFTVQPPA